MTRIAVIGGGNVGGTLGEALLRGGHEVRFGSRTPDAAPALPAPVVAREEAIAWADVVVLTVPGAAAAQVVAEIGPSLAGKTVVDATNRGGAPVMHALEAIATVAPDAVAYRAFNTVGREIMADPNFGTDRADLFFAGPEAGRGVIEDIAESIGFRPVWLGEQDQADLVDALARAWMTLAMRRGWGRDIALRVLSR